MTWNAVIIGPADTPFEDGTFRLVMHFEEQYPNKPPSVKFISQMFHPNVYATGELCLDILQNRWSPTYDVAAVLTSIQRWVKSRSPGGRMATRPRCRSQLTACSAVFSTTRTPDRQRTSRRPTCTRTTARSTPRGFVKRSRRAGRSKAAEEKGRYTIRRVHRQVLGTYGHHLGVGVRIATAGIWGRVFLINKAGSAHSGSTTHTSCKGV